MDAREISARHIALTQITALLGQVQGGMYIKLPYESNQYIDDATKRLVRIEINRQIFRMNNRADKLFRMLGQ